MFDASENKFVYCSQYLGTDGRGIRDKNRILLKELIKETEEVKKKRLVDELIINNRPMVWFIVRNFAKFTDWLEDEAKFNDVIDQGYLHLCEIIQKYDYSKHLENPTGFFGVNLYYRLFGKIKYYINKKEKRDGILEFSEIDPVTEEIPEVLSPAKMEVEYILYNMDKVLCGRELYFIKAIYELLKEGKEIPDIISILADKNDLTRSRIYQIVNKAIRKLKNKYKLYLWDLYD